MAKRKPTKRERRDQRQAFALAKIQRQVVVAKAQTPPMQMADKIMESASPTWRETWDTIQEFDRILARLHRLLMNLQRGDDGIIVVILHMQKDYTEQRDKLLSTVQSTFATAKEALKITSWQNRDVGSFEAWSRR